MVEIARREDFLQRGREREEPDGYEGNDARVCCVSGLEGFTCLYIPSAGGGEMHRWHGRERTERKLDERAHPLRTYVRIRI